MDNIYLHNYSTNKSNNNNFYGTCIGNIYYYFIQINIFIHQAC